MLRLAVFACTINALMAGLAHAGSPEAYTDFELQARSNLLVNDEGFNLPPGSSFNSIDASINANAEIAFTVGVVPDSTSSHPGVWFGSHGEGQLVHEAPSEAFISSRSPLNASGSIAFTLSDTGGEDGIYVFDQASGSAARLATNPVFPNSYGSVAINAGGAVGYQANQSSGRLYAATDDALTTIYTTDSGLDPDSPYTYLYTPSFNDAGHIAAKVATSPDLSTKVEIRLFANDGTSTLVLANQATDPQSAYSRFDNSLDVNGDDVVAVVATRATDNRRVVLRSDGATTTEIAEVDPAGTIREIESFAPAINDRGWVVFRAKDANGQAIYVGDGTMLVRVIGDGDVIETDLGTAQVGQDNGSDPIFSGKPAINANGDIAFIAGLYPQGDNQIEWGSGVFIAYADGSDPDDIVFKNGFDG